MALDEFYNDIIGHLDTFVENYQAVNGLVGVPTLCGDELEGEFLDHLQKEANWLNKNRSKICNEVAALENLFDELTEVYLKAIYKLTNLH